MFRRGPTKTSIGELWARLRRRAEFGDAVLLLYVVAVVRQYAWAVADNRAAWAATAAASALVWLLYVLTKDETDAGGTPAAFWPIVVAPVVLVYAARVALPDASYDVLNYHIFQGERALRFPFFAPGDYFPVIVPFNPTADIAHALARRALGYRLGTVVNLLALLWAARVAEKLLRPFVRDARLRSAGVLAAVLAEQLLFEVNNYMVDLLPLPLILEATRLTLRRDGAGGATLGAGDAAQVAGGAARGGDGAARDAAGAQRDLLRVSFLLGLAVAFKITNLAAVVALAPLWAHRLFFKSRPAPARLAASLTAGALIFVLPILPYTVLIHRLTGSPLFPMYNGIFRSPYWGPHSGWDARFGPHALWEKLLWPLMIPFVPERLSELGVYSGRITLGCVAALVALVAARRDAYLGRLSVVFLVGALAWSFVIGYSRYGLHLELLGGIVVVALAAKLLTPRPPRPARLALAALLCVVLAAQLAAAVYLTSRYEWGGRPAAHKYPAEHASDAALLLRDRSLRSFLAPEDLAKVDQVEVWIECGVRTSGLGVMLRPDAPTIGVRNYEFFASRTAVEAYLAALDRAAGRRMFALCHPPDAESCARVLRDHGLEIAGSTRLRVPHYTTREGFDLDLLEIRRGEPGPLLAAQLRQLPPGGYRARIEAPTAPSAMKAGERAPLAVKVKNVGVSAWPAGNPEGGAFQVNLGGRWLKSDGETLFREVGSRATLPHDIRPGEETELTLVLDAPAEAGDYVLQLDMVHEAITWFYLQGSAPLLVKVRVEP